MKLKLNKKENKETTTAMETTWNTDTITSSNGRFCKNLVDIQLTERRTILLKQTDDFQSPDVKLAITVLID